MKETFGHTVRPPRAGEGLSAGRNLPPKILLFDDNEAFADTWAALLRQKGFTVTAESKVHEVHKWIIDKSFDVILLDLIVQNDDLDGLDVLMDIMTYSNKSQVIVVSGAGTTEQVVTSIKHGACDFISKESLNKPEDVDILIDRIFVALQTPEIRNESAVLRENLIDSLWSNVRFGESHRLGRRLEQLLKLLFETLPAFNVERTNYRTKSQEIDLVLTHHNTHPIWSSLGGVFLGECKNWSPKGPRPQSKDLASFIRKIEGRGPLVRLGFFISYNGFSRGFENELRSYNTGDRLVVPLDGLDIQELVAKRDGIAREEYLRSRVIEATTR